jgi:hypothetical protein
MAQAFRYDGEALVPIRPKLADETFVVGSIYWMEIENPRSGATHNHEFAWLKTAWLQLPHDIADQYPTPTSLRKRALIDAGFFDEKIVDAGTNAAALRVAAYARGEDEFAYVVTRGPLVVVRKAKSQSRRAMGGKDFQASKTAILEVIANLISVSPETLVENAGQAA